MKDDQNKSCTVLSKYKKYVLYPPGTISSNSFPIIKKTFNEKESNKEYFPRINTDAIYTKIPKIESPDDISKDEFDLKHVYEMYFDVIKYKKYLMLKSVEIKNEILSSDELILEESTRRKRILNKDILTRLWRVDNLLSKLLNQINEVIGLAENGWFFVQRIKKILKKKPKKFI